MKKTGKRVTEKESNDSGTRTINSVITSRNMPYFTSLLISKGGHVSSGTVPSRPLATHLPSAVYEIHICKLKILVLHH